jgi:uncharacterized protein (DUF1684 family)
VNVRSRLIFTALISAVLAASLGAACSSNPSIPADDAAAIKEIDAHRADLDRFMREDAASPIPANKKNILIPLRYYPPDTSFSVPAVLNIKSGTRSVMEVPTSTGAPRRVELVGTLDFTLRGQKLALSAFVDEGTRQINRLFVPFADTTSGTDTYPAGRYLDLEPTATGIYTIDFNRAYNPYCAYNNTYECPLPPPSNRLKVAITAGEKLPADHAG